MKLVGYYNGKMGPVEELTVPMNDRALFFGDGCYDATRYHNHVPHDMEAHLDRFYNSCRLMRMDFPMAREELKAELMKCVEACDSADGMLYWQASRGTDYRHHDFPTPEIKPNLTITVRGWGLTPMDKTFRLITLPDLRYKLCNVKSLNLLPNVLAMQEAKEKGCDEVAFIRDGVVTEGAHINISLLKDGAFITHPLDENILPGITRKHLLRFCAELGIPVCERTFTPEELMSADEVIISSSGILCNAVETIDGKKVGGRDPDTLKKLQDASMADFYESTAR